MSQGLVVLTLLGTGIVTGVFFAVAVSVLPALFALTPGEYVRVHLLLGRGYHPVMPLIVNAATVADLVLVIISTGVQRALFAIALAMLIGVQFVSHLCNVPINRALHDLDPDHVTGEWLQDPRPAWRTWHMTRSGLAGTAMLATAVAVALGS